MDINTRIAEISDRIKQAALAASRSADSITLVAVSKVQPEDRIEDALTAGLRVFGENRVQEAQGRWATRRAIYPDLKLHLIGPLQSNKVEDAMALFDVIETVDRPKLVETLAKLAGAGNKLPKLLVQVNTGEEEQKAGVAPRDLPALLNLCAARRLPIEGLMCIPPEDEEPAMHFALLAKLAQRHGLGVLSMGMSGDFEAAITFGATHVRVGSALFGTRVSPA
ncbi:COG0325 Predicted enzyme with a TIM-barrel fold [Caulobacteraceae bacterium]|eukprot:gene16039-21768_t